MQTLKAQNQNTLKKQLMLIYSIYLLIWPANQQNTVNNSPSNSLDLVGGNNGATCNM